MPTPEKRNLMSRWSIFSYFWLLFKYSLRKNKQNKSSIRTTNCFVKFFSWTCKSRDKLLLFRCYPTLLNFQNTQMGVYSIVRAIWWEVTGGSVVFRFEETLSKLPGNKNFRKSNRLKSTKFSKNLYYLVARVCVGGEIVLNTV